MIFERLINLKITRKILWSVLLGTVITSYVSAYYTKAAANISKSVVRFHILANSDSEQDQAVKIKIRDDVAKYIEPMLRESKSAFETAEIIKDNLKNIEEYATQSAKKYGCDYGARATFGNFEFPQREYESATFPSGRYNALRILLGEGEGQNWWCVLYPQLCFTAEDGVLTDRGYEQLKSTLTKDEYEIITSKGKVNFKFKILELFSNQYASKR